MGNVEQSLDQVSALKILAYYEIISKNFSYFSGHLRLLRAGYERNSGDDFFDVCSI